MSRIMPRRSGHVPSTKVLARPGSRWTPASIIELRRPVVVADIGDGHVDCDFVVHRSSSSALGRRTPPERAPTPPSAHDCARSIASAASRRGDGAACAYRSAVMVMALCPSVSLTTLSGTPAAKGAHAQL